MFHEEISKQGKEGDNEMKGLCHRCLTSDTELILRRDQILCTSCYKRKHV